MKLPKLSNNLTLLVLIILVVIIKAALVIGAYFNFDFKNIPWENALSIWNRWDAEAYETIATTGYHAANLKPDYFHFLSHFPPFYPLLIKLISAVFQIKASVSGSLISVISSFGASIMLYKLMIEEFKNKKAAFASAILLNLYPTSYFTIAPYTESLFLLLSISSFYLIRKKHYHLAGVLSIPLVLTRITGAAVIPAYIYILWRERDKVFSKNLVRGLSLLALPILGVLIYLTINQGYYHNALFFLKEYSTNVYSSKSLIAPFRETIANIGEIFKNFSVLKDRDFMMIQGWNAIFIVFSVIITIIGFIKRIPLRYSIYSLALIIFFASFSWGISNARYTLALFPMFMTLGLIKNRYIMGIIAIAFIVLLIKFTFVFTSGSWAF